ncbi:MAG TPA: RidA family protein [bacterium]|nr:RidA family protein [bacterium]
MKKIAYHLNWPSYARIPNAVNAIRAGNLLFLSGCSAVDPDGNVVGLGDMEKQTRQAMENMKAALDAAGATFKNVVHMDTFYADPRLTQQMIHVRSSYFSSENPYTTTGVQVAGFGKPGMLVEMDAIAVLDDDHE